MMPRDETIIKFQITALVSLAVALALGALVHFDAQGAILAFPAILVLYVALPVSIILGLIRSFQLKFAIRTSWIVRLLALQVLAVAATILLSQLT